MASYVVVVGWQCQAEPPVTLKDCHYLLAWHHRYTAVATSTPHTPPSSAHQRTDATHRCTCEPTNPRTTPTPTGFWGTVVKPQVEPEWQRSSSLMDMLKKIPSPSNPPAQTPAHLPAHPPAHSSIARPPACPSARAFIYPSVHATNSAGALIQFTWGGGGQPSSLTGRSIMPL